MKPPRLKTSERILKKLQDKHRVGIEEVWECFMNRIGRFLEMLITKQSHQRNCSHPGSIIFKKIT
jgi:hypothetical protein